MRGREAAALGDVGDVALLLLELSLAFLMRMAFR